VTARASATTGRPSGAAETVGTAATGFAPEPVPPAAVEHGAAEAVPVQATRPAPDPAAELTAEVVVVGAGPAGVAAAQEIAAAAVADEPPGRGLARRCGLRLVVVDDASAGWGGWSGRLAVAALQEAATRHLAWSEAGSFMQRARREIVARHHARLLALQVQLGEQALMLPGRAWLSGPGRVMVEQRGAGGRGGTRLLSARRVVLATGCVLAMPEVAGLLDTEFVTAPEVGNLLDDDRPPATAAVLGAGSTGCALAQALARLGVAVTLVDEHETVLFGEDADAAAAVTAALHRDGVRLLLGSPVVKVAPTLDGGAWLGAASGVDVAAERLVLATGWRAASGGLALPGVGVAVDPSGAVRVDSALVTSVPEVLAAGGVVAGEPHATAALAMGAVAGANAVSRRPGATWSAATVATLTLTDPEVASVGLTGPGVAGAGLAGPGQVRARQVAVDGVTTGTASWSEVDRAVLCGAGEGFVRVVVGHDGHPGSRWSGRRKAPGTVRVLGATVVGCRAGDLVAPLALAIGSGLPACRLATAVSADPTWAGALRLAVSRACTPSRRARRSGSRIPGRGPRVP
jgi:pyruvate/2-oxoglutarate dehydrogenase complex dihydrolipoamide dehydrogenase (E3) component